MFITLLFILAALIINWVFNDFVKDTKYALTPAGMNVSFSVILAVLGFWNPILWWIAAAVVLSYAHEEFNRNVYRVQPWTEKAE